MRRVTTLLDAITEFQLGKIDSNEWLRRLASVAGATDACTGIWSPGNPKEMLIVQSGQWNCFTQPFRYWFDEIVRTDPPERSTLLRDMAACDTAPEDVRRIIYDPHTMIAVLDTKPAVAMTALRCPSDRDGWSEEDRDRYRTLLPSIFRSHSVHKKIRLTEYYLHIADDALDSLAMGIAAMTPDAQTIQINKLARKILADKQDFYLENNHLRIADKRMQEMFSDQLTKIRQMPLDDLKTHSWNSSFVSEADGANYQICLQAFPNPEWNMVSSPFDRYLILTFQSPDTRISPTPEQLTEFYGLTKAQARLVAALMEGRSVSDAADYLNVSINTARSHLRSIYTRLGVSGQTELTGMIAQTIVKYVPENPDDSARH